MRSITFWTRLEPRAREGTMARGLQAQVRDPLWLLARQWQLGEFLGKDAGSPIQATYQVESRSLSGYRPGMGSSMAVPLDESVPLEAQVEREAVILGLRGAVQLGLRFEALMKAADLTMLIAAFRKAYSIESTPPARDFPDVASRQFRLAVADRVTDGNQLYSVAKAALADPLVFSHLPLPTEPEKQQVLRQVLQDFVKFRESLYSEQPPDRASPWIEKRLEYQFSISSHYSSETITLSAPEFPGGHLDWYSFALSADQLITENQASVQQHIRTTIPNHVTFQGMPNNRWWNFEDGNTDFGQLDTEHVDLAKMLVIEFAVAYGNDWFDLPIRLPVGSLSKVTLLVVTDTFGERTLIRPTMQQSPVGQQPWSLFTLSEKQLRSEYLLLPPALESTMTMDGAALEDVLFLRDEMAAMAWAVERTLQGPLDAPVDGYASYLQRLRDNPPPGPPNATPGGPDIYYLLGTMVPDNWLPLVPVKGPLGELLFRRGVIERLEGELFARGQVLGPPYHPFVVSDQTVSRAGTQVTRYFRRARWSDGKTYTWMARKTRPGRGPGWAGLAFDLIEPMGQAPSGVNP